MKKKLGRDGGVKRRASIKVAPFVNFLGLRTRVMGSGSVWCHLIITGDVHKRYSLMGACVRARVCRREDVIVCRGENMLGWVLVCVRACVCE